MVAGWAQPCQQLQHAVGEGESKKSLASQVMLRDSWHVEYVFPGRDQLSQGQGKDRSVTGMQGEGVSLAGQPCTYHFTHSLCQHPGPWHRSCLVGGEPCFSLLLLGQCRGPLMRPWPLPHPLKQEVAKP